MLFFEADVAALGTLVLALLTLAVGFVFLSELFSLEAFVVLERTILKFSLLILRGGLSLLSHIRPIRHKAKLKKGKEKVLGLGRIVGL